MIKWISFILQMLMLKNTFGKSVSTLDYLQRTAERARGYFLFALGSTISALFLMTSCIVGVIGIGLQIEQQGYIRLTGLILSSVIFLVLAVGIFSISLILLAFQKKKMAEEMLRKQRMNAGNSVFHLLEEILKQVLLNLSNPKPHQESERPRQNQETI